jgi:hypothetical protein
MKDIIAAILSGEVPRDQQALEAVILEQTVAVPWLDGI